MQEAKRCENDTACFHSVLSSVSLLILENEDACI